MYRKILQYIGISEYSSHYGGNQTDQPNGEHISFSLNFVNADDNDDKDGDEKSDVRVMIQEQPPTNPPTALIVIGAKICKKRHKNW